MNPITFLRRVLFFDAATCAAMGALFVLAAVPVADLLMLPAGLVLEAGMILIPFAAFVGWTATRADLDGWPVRAVIAINALWVIASFALLAAAGIAPNPLGSFIVMAQALAGGGLAALQAWSLARTRALA